MVMNRTPLGRPTPWLFLQSVGLVEPDTIIPTDEYGQEVRDVPPPISTYLIGVYVDPRTGQTENLIVGVVGPPWLMGQVIDAIRASAESRGASEALTAAVDQARAARSDRAHLPREYPACIHRPDTMRAYYSPCPDCPEGVIL